MRFAVIIFTTLLGQTSARQIYDKDVSTSRWRELLVNSTTRTGPTLNTTNLIVKNFNETLTERIVNGDQAPQGRFPYLGFLTANDCAPSTIHGDCGSTLVSPRVVVTAGHCMFQCGSETWDGLPGETRGPPGFSYTYGSANVKLNRWDMLNSNEPGAEDKDIVKVVRHPWYKRDNSINIPAQNDIALLQLNSKSEVIPVRLNKNETFENGTTFQVAGWGSTNQEGTQFPNIIRYASVPYVPLEECRADLSYNVWEKNVCAGGGPDQADTCIGDSGGPMVLNGLEDPDKHEQVGITSYGAPCGEAPAVYVNVAEQRDWIDNAILLNNMLGYVEPSIQTSYRLQHRYLSNKMRQRFNITSSGECSLTCKADNMGCKSWSYDSELNKCYMMANVTKVVVNAAFTSGNITGYVIVIKKDY